MSPFSFSALPKLSSADLRLAKHAPSVESVLRAGGSWQEALKSVLQTVAHEDLSFSFDNMSLMTNEAFWNLSSTGNCFITLSWPLKNEWITLELDARAAKTLVYNMLGSEPSKGGGDDLSDVEQGLLSFIVLKVLNAWQTAAGTHPVASLKLIEIGTSPGICQKYLTKDEPRVLLSYQLIQNQESSFCRISTSLDFMDHMAFSNDDKQIQVARSLKRCASVLVPIIAEAGRVNLKSSELSALDVDDIVVLENCSAHLRELGLVGSIQVQIGTEEYGSFKGNLLLTKSGRYALQVSNTP